MLIGLELDLSLAVGGPDPRATDFHATATEGDLAILMAVAHCGAIWVPLALRADDLIDLLLQHLAQHLQPGPYAQRQQPLLRCPNKLAQRLRHALGENGLITGRLRDRYVATNGGSSLDLCRIAANAPNTSGRGRRDRRHLKLLRAPGQPLRKTPLAQTTEYPVPGRGPQTDQMSPTVEPFP